MPTDRVLAMDDKTPPHLRWAVFADPKGPAVAALNAHLQAREIPRADWFAPKDGNDLDDAIRNGSIDAVLTDCTATLLQSLFDREVHLDEWTKRGVRIDTLRDKHSPEHKPSSTPGEFSVAALDIYEAYSDWRGKWARRRV